MVDVSAERGARFLADPVARVTGVCLLLVALPYVFPFFSPDTQLAYGSLYAALPFHLLTLVVALTAARRQASPQARRFWFLIAGAAACWIGNKFLGIAHGARTFESPVDLISDVLFVGFYLFFALAIEQEPHREARSQGLMQLRRIGTAVAAFCFLVYFAVLPAALNVEAYLSWLPSMLLYIVLDVYVLVRFLLMSRDATAGVWRGIYGLLALTAGLWLGNDALEALAIGGVIDLPPPGHPIDAVFFLKFFTLVAAARLGAMIEVIPGPYGDEALEPETGDGSFIAFVLALPVLHYGLYSLGWLDEGTRSARGAWVSFSLVLLAVGGILYHRRLVEENRRLWARAQTAIVRLQASERLEALGRLAGGIAHDFNNVLTVVIGNADLARSSTAAEGRREHLDAVTRAAEGGAELVKKLLGFGRRDLVATKPTDLAEFVRRVAGEWRRVMPENVTLWFHDSSDTPTVQIDASVFESVVVNLLTNARDSMPQGGRVDIETRTRTITAEEAAPGVTPGVYGCLEVRDAGVGMDRETLARVFDPFFTTKPVGVGAGMGLSMVYGIVKQHDGVIDVESAPGQGTVVTICLPISGRPVDAGEGSASERTEVVAAGTETILLVEDEPAVRRMAADLLESRGFVVLPAKDGIDAMQIFEQRQDEIHLVLSDVVMPLMGGLELFKQIRGVPSDVPFVFMSGYASDPHRGGKLPPTVSLVAKPWRSEVLLEEVRRALATTS